MTSRETETHCVGTYSGNTDSFKSPVLGANELKGQSVIKLDGSTLKIQSGVILYPLVQRYKFFNVI